MPRPARILLKAEATRALRQLGREGLVKFKSLEPRLRRAVLMHWGSMQAARDELGLAAPPAPRQRWSRKLVIEEIRRLARDGTHMSFDAIKRAGRLDMLLAAKAYVGSWTRAREIAGVSFRPNRTATVPKWDAQSLVEAIKERAEAGLPLASSKAPKSLTGAACRIFGSWRAAIGASGLDYGSILLLRPVSDAELLRWLRSVAHDHPTMTLFELDKWGGHAVACRRRWGSYEAAAAAAQLASWPVRIRHEVMTRASVVRKLRALRRQDPDVTMEFVRRSRHGQQLLNGIFQHFGSWKSALSAIDGGRAGRRAAHRSS